MARRQPRRLPELKPCPECGVKLEAGKGEFGLAYHGCVTLSDATKRDLIDRLNALLQKPGLTTVEAEEMLLRVILARSADDHVGITELTGMVRELRESGGGRAASSARGKPKTRAQEQEKGSLLRELAEGGDDGEE